MATQIVPSNDAAISTMFHVLEELKASYRGEDFAVRFWDGTLWSSSQRPRFTLIVNEPQALRSMFLSPSELSMGEAFVKGYLDVEGDMEAAFGLTNLFIHTHHTFKEKLRIAGLLMKLPTPHHPDAWRGYDLKGAIHSKQRDRNAVRYHYDLSNDFYALWLDKEMVYSCAYFRSPKDDVDKAQKQKLDYICRKLRLKPGEQLLDLGSGWGALLIHAARHYGVNAVGITLSVRQAEWAREHIRQAGLNDRCKVVVCDYRDLEVSQQFDKIVSVGMFEHVGQTLLPEYFRRAWELLRAGGVFLNHGIAVAATFKRKGPSFIGKYVFPDGELVPLNTTLRAAEECAFEVRDVESLREHYALTLRHWVQRLQAKAAEARRIVGEENYRIWRLYMSGAAHGFTTGRMNVFQILLSKSESGVAHLPLTREDWLAA